MLTAIKVLHTAIYALMVAAIFFILYCGITGTRNLMLAISIGLICLEGAVFFGNGRMCPLTNLAKKYGDPKGYVGDLFCPEWLSRRTFSVFTTLFLIGLVLVAIRLVMER
jgi:hypothetical protein